MCLSSCPDQSDTPWLVSTILGSLDLTDLPWSLARLDWPGWSILGLSQPQLLTWM